MNLDRRSMFGALAALLSAPALARPKPRHPRAVRQHAERSGADGTAHATRVAQPRHRAPSDRSREATRIPPNLPLVVIDAGHGGHDPGAVGGSGTPEKDVALATAVELGRQL